MGCIGGGNQRNLGIMKVEKVADMSRRRVQTRGGVTGMKK